MYVYASVLEVLRCYYCDCSFFQHVDKDLTIISKYEAAISVGGTFLTSFLNKCRSRSEEVDFRPLFENFVHDLLTTVNKPEWPATELLLSLLGTMLVRLTVIHLYKYSLTERKKYILDSFKL